MEIIIDDGPALARLAADAMSELVTTKPAAVLGLATGSSPLPIYQSIISRQREETIDFSRVTAFTLDEYVGLAADHPQRYRNVISDEFTSHINIDPNNVHGPDGNAADLVAACQLYEDSIAAAGGVDLQILGIGSDGHIAFNEPGSSLGSRTRLKSLTPQTRADNARFFGGDVDQVPRHCLTQGMSTIMNAQHIILIATGRAKAQAIHHMVEGAISAMWPASILQMHPHTTVLVDDDAASDLQYADYYRQTFQHKPSWQSI